MCVCISVSSRLFPHPEVRNACIANSKFVLTPLAYHGPEWQDSERGSLGILKKKEKKGVVGVVCVCVYISVYSRLYAYAEIRNVRLANIKLALVPLAYHGLEW